MVRMNRITAILMLLGAVFVVTGCDLDDLSGPARKSASEPSLSAQEQSAVRADTRTYSGPAVPVGDGVGFAWVTVDRDGVALAMGVELSEKALINLPMHPMEWVLALPSEVRVAPYDHVGLDYNPAGHEPPGVYDLEHFDVHFYMISEKERSEIGPNDPGFDLEPNPIYLPEDYLRVPGGVPGMGAHWVDLLAPEFNGGVFTRTFIWGTFGGRVVFLEPMVTVEALTADEEIVLPVRQPQAFQRDGYYPKSYRTSYLERTGGYRVALDGLTYHAGVAVERRVER